MSENEAKSPPQEEHPVNEIPKKLTKEEKRALAAERSKLPISNTCRNCHKPLELDMRFCHGCGAKRMYNRLNRRNLLDDFADRFLNFEAGFPKTFIALFRCPEDVVNGYVHGVRKKYLSAFSYFAISLTLLGIYAFVFKNFFLTEDFFIQNTANFEGAEELQESVTRLTMDLVSTVMEYQSVTTFLTLPLVALISRVVFWNYKEYNYIEHLVIYLYLYSHLNIIITVLTMLFGWSSTIQLILSSLMIFGYLGYFIYALQRIFNLSAASLVLKTLLFLGITFVMLIIIGVVVSLAAAYAFKSGALDDTEIVRMIKEIGEQQNAIQEAAKAAKDSIRIDSISRLKAVIPAADSSMIDSIKSISVDSLRLSK